MSINYLIAIAICAAAFVTCALILRVAPWVFQVVEAKHRRRHAVRRRERCKGYIPIHDEQWALDLTDALKRIER